MVTLESTFGSIFENIPDIIRAAAENILGILALVIIAIAILAYIFFKKEKSRVKIIIFSSLLLVAVILGYAVLRMTENGNGGNVKNPTNVKNDSIPPNTDSTFLFESEWPDVNARFTEKLKSDGYKKAPGKPKYSIKLLSEPVEKVRHTSVNPMTYYYNPSQVYIKINEQTPIGTGVIIPRTDRKPDSGLALIEFKNNCRKSIDENFETIYKAIKDEISE